MEAVPLLLSPKFDGESFKEMEDSIDKCWAMIKMGSDCYDVYTELMLYLEVGGALAQGYFENSDEHRCLFMLGILGAESSYHRIHTFKKAVDPDILSATSRALEVLKEMLLTLDRFEILRAIQHVYDNPCVIGRYNRGDCYVIDPTIKKMEKRVFEHPLIMHFHDRIVCGMLENDSLGRWVLNNPIIDFRIPIDKRTPAILLSQETLSEVVK